jgi:hypothetical protein
MLRGLEFVRCMNKLSFSGKGTVMFRLYFGPPVATPGIAEALFSDKRAMLGAGVKSLIDPIRQTQRKPVHFSRSDGFIGF